MHDLSPALTRYAGRARSEAGYTMAMVIMAMLALMSLSAAAFAAAGGDIRLGERNVESKRAYAAAEAGVAYYLQKLGQDTDFWTRCTNDPNPPPTGNPVHQKWNGVGADPRTGWRALPTDAAAQYAIELLPTAGFAQCVENTNESMIDPDDGTLRIRSTGRSRGVYRSVVATLRRKGFLDYIYFTDIETSDPAQQILGNDGSWRNPTVTPLRRGTPAQALAGTVPDDSLAAWAAQPSTCMQWTRPEVRGPGRASVTGYPGSGYFDPSDGRPLGWHLTSDRPGVNNLNCSPITFGTNDKNLGPFHTNDTMRVCGSAVFGRPGKSDLVEYYAYQGSNGCSSTPSFGTSVQRTGANLVPIDVPPSNVGLRATTESGYVFTGRTTIALNGSTMTVTGPTGVVQTKPLPPRGLIYVENDPNVACPPFNVFDPYAAAPGCGDVYVSGTFAKGLTIAAARDVVVTGNVTETPNSDSLLGLIADNFVRVAHPVAAQPCNSGTANVPAGQSPRTIHAAILSLNHVFTVDNYQCGSTLGTLTVKGAIAQKFRGPVGTSGASTGYVKDYQYDDRLKFRSPPYFITPVQAAWRTLRITEQSPATRPATP